MQYPEAVSWFFLLAHFQAVRPVHTSEFAGAQVETSLNEPFGPNKEHKVLLEAHYSLPHSVRPAGAGWLGCRVLIGYP
jgi:hypothetical protein